MEKKIASLNPSASSKFSTERRAVIISGKGKNQSAESPIGTTSGPPPRVPRPKAEIAVKKKPVENVESRKSTRSMSLRGSKEKDRSLSPVSDGSDGVPREQLTKSKKTAKVKSAPEKNQMQISSTEFLKPMILIILMDIVLQPYIVSNHRNKE